MSTVITEVDPRSPADRAGVRRGEKLLAINGHSVTDVLDYRFFGYDKNAELLLEDEQGKRRTVRVRKADGVELGLNFDTYLMDKPMPCSNHCLFCFVDQMAPGMRSTLYFKDDDARLSFLMGNYITLTNLSDREIQRILDLRISPINVSVHATDPRLRCTLLGNRDAAKSLDTMRTFGRAGIEMNGQIVVCPGWNDGAQLQKTMEDMEDMGFHSCSVVPVGLTKYREGLCRLRPVEAKEAVEIVRQVEAFGEKCLQKHGERRFFCSDELYLRAGLPLPEEEFYEGYIQLENGVGMLRSLVEEFRLGLARLQPPEGPRTVAMATGTSCAPFLRQLLGELRERCPQVSGTVYPIVNDFFGHTIDVAGLVTAGDLIRQLRPLREQLPDRLLLPVNMLRHGGDVFLDDLRVSDVEEALGVRVRLVEQDGFDLLDAILEGPEGS